MNIGSSSGSSYVNKASSNKGFSGIASGLDTEGMVEGMLANTQAKIDKQKAMKQQTIWKQDMYRNIISQINTFQKKYFDIFSASSLRSPAFFNAMSALSTSTAFKATATSGAATGSTKVAVHQLATTSSITSGEGVSGVLAGEMDLAALADQKVTLNVDGADVTVDLQGATTNEAVAQKITDTFANLPDTDPTKGKVTAAVKDGKLTITGKDNTVNFTVGKSSVRGLKKLGLTTGATAYAGDAATAKALSGTINLDETLSFKVSLDDNEKTITLNLAEVMKPDNSGIDTAKFGSAVQTQLDRQLGTNQVTASVDASGKLAFAVKAGRKVTIGGEGELFEMLGMKNGQSNRIGLGGKLQDLYFKEALQGNNFAFTINGKEFKFAKDAYISDVIRTINASDAGVIVSYKPFEDKFVMETSDSGEGHSIALTQTKGNLLNAMFGGGALNSGTSVSSGALFANNVKAGAQPADIDYTKITKGSFNIAVDGKAYTFSLPPKKNKDDATKLDPYTKDEMVAELNKQMSVRFGADQIVLKADGNLDVKNGKSVSIPKSEISNPDDAAIVKAQAEGGDLALALGLGKTGASNAATGDTTLAELGLTGLTDSGTGADGTKKLSELTGAFSFALGDPDKTDAISSKIGQITFSGTGENQVAGTDVLTKKLFGTESVDFGTATGAAATKTDGINAIVEIDGAITERSNNSFTVNGINYNLTQVSAKNPDGTFISDSITVNRNTDQVVDGIKGFIEDYNKLIKSLNDTIGADTTYKDYAPLTEAQKKEMSEKEIEKWEEKAQEGLLHNDPVIGGFLGNMRSMLYSKPDGVQFALYDLGIETSSDYKEKGKLVMSTDGEATLRKMLENNPDEITKLFTGPGGLAQQLNTTIDQVAKISSGAPGTLVQLAGVKGKASESSNTLFSQMKAIDERIATLKRSYDKEKNRYWKQFNAMEQVVSNMNNQSSWLMQQFG